MMNEWQSEALHAIAVAAGRRVGWAVKVMGCSPFAQYNKYLWDVTIPGPMFGRGYCARPRTSYDEFSPNLPPIRATVEEAFVDAENIFREHELNQPVTKRELLEAIESIRKEIRGE